MDLVSRIRLFNWSLRKLRLGIRPGDLVLDVGSGGNPHPRADVLLEKYPDGGHRHGAAAVASRPLVFADAGKMPFRDKAFDFVISFHVLEHMRYPELFLKELARVGKAGYIETPNVVFERFVPYDVHLLEIAGKDGMLHIRKKPEQVTDPYLEKLQLQRRDPAWQRAVYGNPELFHVRHFWKGEVRYHIENPEETCEWFQDFSDAQTAPVEHETPGNDWRSKGLQAIRRFQHWRRPNRNLDDLLVCPDCHGSFAVRDNLYVCAPCKQGFVRRPTPNFNTPIPV